MYKGYYCKKCKNIPIICANVDENDQIKYLIKCKCRLKNFNLEKLNKLYYYDSININSILNGEILDKPEIDNSLLLKINKCKIYFENINETLTDNKNYILNILKTKYEEFKEVFNSVINKNNEYNNLINRLIDSYKLIPSNYSNILNIKNIIHSQIFEELKEKLNCRCMCDDNNLNDSKFYELINYERKLFKEQIEKNVNSLSNFIKDYTKDFECINKYDIHLFDIDDKNSFVQLEKLNIQKIDDNLLLCFNDHEKKFFIYSIKLLETIHMYENKLNNLLKFLIDKKNIICLMQNYIKIYELNIEPPEKNNYYFKLKFLKENFQINLDKKYNNIIKINTKSEYERKYILYNEKALELFAYDIKKKLILNKFAYDCDIKKLYLINYLKKDVLFIINNKEMFLFDIKEFKTLENSKIITKIYIKDFSFNFSVNVVQINDNEIIIKKSCKRYSQTGFEKVSNFFLKKKRIHDPDDILIEYYYISDYFQISENKILLQITIETVLSAYEYCSLYEIKI